MKNILLIRPLQNILDISQDYDYLWKNHFIRDGKLVVYRNFVGRKECNIYVQHQRDKFSFGIERLFDHFYKKQLSAIEIAKGIEKINLDITSYDLMEGFFNALEIPLGDYLGKTTVRGLRTEYEKRNS